MNTTNLDPNALVEIDGIYKSFGQTVVLDNVSLTVHPGETLALIGPSGGGKSTLLRCINGLVRPDRGKVSVLGHILPNASEKEDANSLRTVRTTFGMIFQDFQLFPHLSVIENITEAPIRVLGRPKELVREEAKKLLERVGLHTRADARPSELSGGQKQRVAIARALAMKPKGLLCDEITSALDPELKGEVLDVLSDLALEGLALVVVTHEMGFARRAASRVAVLAGGHIIEVGPPDALFSSPQEERTRKFLERVLA